MTGGPERTATQDLHDEGMALTHDYKNGLLKRLTDPEFAAGYLSECAREGQGVFLLALRDVAEAAGGIGRLAEAAELARESLYGMLSENGNPKLSSLFAVLDALGLQFKCVPAHGS
jgi:probable addiction module antidote protein